MWTVLINTVTKEVIKIAHDDNIAIIMRGFINPNGAFVPFAAGEYDHKTRFDLIEALTNEKNIINLSEY